VSAAQSCGDAHATIRARAAASGIGTGGRPNPWRGDLMALEDPEPADVMALVRAHMRDDEDAILALLSVVDEQKLFPFAIDFTMIEL
jgi:hypothetical protein